MARLIRMVEPDEIHNLVALSHVAVSFRQPKRQTATEQFVAPTQLDVAIQNIVILGLSCITA